jgi:long-chain acyl-CoA synthetase
MKLPRLTLPQMLRRSVIRRRRADAIVFEDHTLSYATLWDEVNRVAAGLQKLGLRRGDRVVIMMQNCPQFVIAYFGVLQAGGIVSPTSPIYTVREASHQWLDCGAKVAIASASLRPVVEGARSACPDLAHVVWTGDEDYKARAHARLRRTLVGRGRPLDPTARDVRWAELVAAGRRPVPVPVRPSDVACLQYTGGTTGTSKGTMLTHSNLVSNAHQAVEFLLRDHDLSGEKLMAALPLFHIYATTCVMLTTLRCGGSMVILPRFELNSVLRAVKRHRPTMYHGVPTMYVAFNSTPGVRRYGFSSLRTCMSGGAPLPVSVREQFEALTGGRLVEGYGLTEASPVTHINPPGRARAGSIGVLIANTRARVVDVETGTRELPDGEAGELLIRGPQVMKGYWGKPEETARVLRNGWLHTGDIAKRDADGFYYIVDRKKDLIIAGGYNVYPREVEEVLFEHPAIQEAVVIGIPDAYRGESVKAFVVLKPGTSPSAEEIAGFCRERLAAYKVPRVVEFRDSLPKSGVGKYLRRELREA